MNSNDFCDINSILAEVQMLVNDEDLRKGVSKGFLVSGIEQCMQELALDTFFMTVTKDLKFDSDKLQLEMPKNCFNIREIYMWNGKCCSPESSVIVHYKRLYNNHNGGAGYTARRQDDQSANTNIDPFFQQSNLLNSSYITSVSSLYYANIQNGTIMFSSSCKGFENVRLVYNAMGVDEIGDEPIIPRMLRQAFIDYSVERYYRVMLAKDSRAYSTLWRVADVKLNDFKTGSMYLARKRIASMDTWSRDAYREFFAKKW